MKTNGIIYASCKRMYCIVNTCTYYFSSCFSTGQFRLHKKQFIFRAGKKIYNSYKGLLCGIRAHPVARPHTVSVDLVTTPASKGVSTEDEISLPDKKEVNNEDRLAGKNKEAGD